MVANEQNLRQATIAASRAATPAPSVLDSLAGAGMGRMGNYMAHGMFATLGMDPDGVRQRSGSVRWGYGDKYLETFSRKPGQIMPELPGMGMLSDLDPSFKKGFLNTYGWPALGIGGTAASLIWGFSENGMKGLYDAAVFDIAQSAGATRWGMPGLGKTDGTFKYSKMKWMGNFITAGIGAHFGQQIAGSPGAIAGGYLGGMVGAAILKNPITMGATVVAGGAAMIGYGTYQVLKAGRQYQRSKRGIDTSGDMSAFMTRNAFTMRERAVQAISKSHLNARSALGQEANFLHHTGRNFHSIYR